MKKKILISLAVIVVLLVVSVFYLNYRNRTLSPPGNVSITSGDLTVSVTYSRPSARGRLVFGSEEQKALQPYGKYWRLGANEATEVSFSKDVIFNGSPVRAGTYRMYAFPGAETFEIGLNTELGEWGYMEPDYSKDVLRTKVAVEKLDPPVEQYTIRLQNQETQVQIIFEWSDTRFRIPIQKQ